jgi:hypothetical protein
LGKGPWPETSSLVGRIGGRDPYKMRIADATISSDDEVGLNGRRTRRVRDAAPRPDDVVSQNRRSWIAWLLPFLVSGGMALGALIGLTIVSDAARQEGPAGDRAGAAGALAIVTCIVVGFVMATLTVIVAELLRRGAPDRIGRRLGLSVLGGGIIGALASSTSMVATAVAWLLLLGVPVRLAWSSRAKAVSGAETHVA